MAHPLFTILHLETGCHLYGGALQVLYLLEGLKKEGVRNLLLCPQGSRIEAAARDLAEVLPIRYRGDLDPRLLHAAVTSLRRYRPDLLHVHSRRGADWWGGLAARITSTSAIVTRRVDNPEKSPLSRAKYQLFQKVVTISEGIRNVLLENGISAEKLVCVRSGIPLEQGPIDCDRPKFLADFNLPAKALTVAVVAQLIPRKGHRFLIQAMPTLLDRFPEARFLFFGQGPCERELKQQCTAAALVDQVRFAGFHHHMTQLLPCIDVIAHPATMEGLGIALLEAAAARRPIVASAVGGIPEIVQNEENGLLVPCGDPHALTTALSRLLADEALRARLGSQGRRRVKEKFSTRSMVAGNLQVYSSLLGTGRRPAREPTASA